MAKIGNPSKREAKFYEHASCHLDRLEHRFGDVLDTIRRRNFVVATDSGGWLYLVKASALETRWEDVGGMLMDVARSFRVPQEE